MGELSARPDDAYGGALLGFSILNRSSSYDLTSLVWRMLLQHWPHPLQQHDSGEFHRHVLTFLQPPAYDGEWQARLSNPCQIIDSGRLTTPILVHPTGNTLAPSMEICYQATSYLSRISRAPRTTRTCPPGRRTVANSADLCLRDVQLLQLFLCRHRPSLLRDVNLQRLAPSPELFCLKAHQAVNKGHVAVPVLSCRHKSTQGPRPGRCPCGNMVASSREAVRAGDEHGHSSICCSRCRRQGAASAGSF